MRAWRATVRKTICGLLAASVLLAVPVTVRAEEPAVLPQETASQPTAINDQPASPAAAVTSPGQPATVTADPASGNENQAAATPSSADHSDDQPAVPTTGSATGTPSVEADTSLTSQAASGNAAVKDNRTGGNAISGDATASATVLNVANADGSSTGSFRTFDCDIIQDLQQNIVVDPSTLMPLPYCNSGNLNGTSRQLPAGNGTSLQSGGSLATILNSIVLSAGSGTATVSGNRNGGNAGSGSATALANVVNLANTTISSKNSFIGIINIYGSLKGDILVPQSFVDSLADGGAAGGKAAGGTTITNNVSLSAGSGTATVSGNRNGGNAGSGQATTGLTVLNLTGQRVIARNSLLVFVNVLGEWMGMIVPAAGSSNTAMLGGGLQSGGVTPATGLQDQAGISGNDSNIVNTVSLNARSGDAAVTANQNGGNATSGSARAGANLLNITNSDFWLQDWFGALFINVLGSWAGDFDIQNNALPAANGDRTQPIQDVRVFRFEAPASVTPAADVSRPVASTSTALQAVTVSESDNADGAADGRVLAASDTGKLPAGNGNLDKPSRPSWLLATGLVLSLTAVIGTAVARRL